MASDFDREKFLKSMQTAVREKNRAAQLGRHLAEKGLQRIFFVGCGAPNREMSVVMYWVEKFSTQLEVRRYFPAELIKLNPPKLDKDTLVIFGSHSGTTPEMVQAAKFIKQYPCSTVGITQTGDSPLPCEVQNVLLYGKSPDEGYQHGYYSMFMILVALTAGILKSTDGWDLYDQVMKSLDAFPTVLADVMDDSEKRVTDEARIYKDDRLIYLAASGPMFCTAYVFGVCVLMEMQWMHTYPVEASEWFHGPFEIVDQYTPIILLLGEDDSRPIAERVVRFCKKYTERLIIFDSKNYEMQGITKDARSIFAPFVLQAALDRFAEHLAVWHNHPLITRRYMWKTEY
ncbi:MAG: SIS domain-containing protein [Anaerolineales bacterium]|nr:SIS domain-containing protein [Anaerolineales bacterium]